MSDLMLQDEWPDFFRLLDKVLLDLNTLAQIQATVGGLKMSSEANETFSHQAKLENYLEGLRYENGKEAN